MSLQYFLINVDLSFPLCRHLKLLETCFRGSDLKLFRFKNSSHFLETETIQALSFMRLAIASVVEKTVGVVLYRG